LRVALIACSNGLGHIRRLLCISKELIKAGVKPYLFAPKTKAIHLIKSNKLKQIPYLIEFNCKTNSEYWRRKYIQKENFLEWIPNLSNYDIIISDNLIEILKIRPDAILSGTFFWHRTFKNVCDKKFNTCEDLLSKYSPIIISSELFTPEYIIKRKNYKKVGLYKFKNTISNKPNGKNILISSGTGGNSEKLTRELIDYIDINYSQNDLTFNYFIEEKFKEKISNNIFKKATFNQSMYESVACSIIRPGIGTVTDSLLTRSRIFSIFEQENYEMRTNALNIEKAGLGVSNVNPIELWKQAISYIQSPYQINNHYKKLSSLDFNGAKQTANIVLS